MHVEAHCSIEQLRRLAKAQKQARMRIRLQAVVLAREGKTALQIVAALGAARRPGGITSPGQGARRQGRRELSGRQARRLLDAATGMFVQLLVAPLYTHDLRHTPDAHPMLRTGDVLLGDRAYCSYGHLALLHLRGVWQ